MSFRSLVDQSVSLLKVSQKGAKLAEQYRRRPVPILPMNSHAIATAHQSLGAEEYVPAVLIFEQSLPTIFLQPKISAELGAALLAHEMSHCYDRTYRRRTAELDSLYEAITRLKQKAVRESKKKTGKPEAELTLEDCESTLRLALIKKIKEYDSKNQRRVFFGETHAYREQNIVINELKTNVRGYSQFISETQKEYPKLGRSISKAEIIAGYGLNFNLFY